LNTSEVYLLQNEIIKLSEDQFRRVIIDFFQKCGFNVKDHHGSRELGADIIVLLKEKDDILLRGQILFIQVKVGVINSNKWRTEISNQLHALRDRHPHIPNVNSSLSRRIVLITTGKLTKDVNDYIDGYNLKNDVPIEVFSEQDCAELFYNKGYKMEDLTHNAYFNKIGEPSLITDEENIQIIENADLTDTSTPMGTENNI
jgi:Restriction endonuclease